MNLATITKDYPAHVAGLQRAYETALAASGYDAVVVHGGAAKKRSGSPGGVAGGFMASTTILNVLESRRSAMSPAPPTFQHAARISGASAAAVGPITEPNEWPR